MGTEKNRNRLSGQLEHGEESDKTNGDQMAGGKALVDEGELDGAGRSEHRPCVLPDIPMVRHHAHAELRSMDVTPKLNMVAFNSSCTTIERQTLIYLILHTPTLEIATIRDPRQCSLLCR